jgi:phosphatidylglycerophosphate synthase
MLMIILLLLDCYPFAWLGGISRDITAIIIIGFATIMTVVSGVDYVIKNKNVLKDNTDN